MDILEQRQLAPLLKKLRIQHKKRYADVVADLGDRVRPWLDGTSLPSLEGLSEIRSYFAIPEPPAGQMDALSVALFQDQSMYRDSRNYSKDERLDKDGAQAFGKAFSELTDRWMVQHGKTSQNAIYTALGMTRNNYRDYRSGNQVPLMHSLRNVVEKLDPTPEDKKTLVAAAFKARRLGAYETQEELVAALPTMQDKGAMFSRFRRARLLSTSDVADAIGVTTHAVRNYELGMGYADHADALAKLLVPEGAREEFLKAVRRTHKLKTLDEAFGQIGNYHSFLNLLTDVAYATNHDIAEAGKAAGMDFHNGRLPDEKKLAVLAKLFGLTQAQSAAMAGCVERLREQKAYEHSDERIERIGRAENLPGFFENLQDYHHFGDFMRDLRQIHGWSADDVVERMREPCTRANISRLELLSHAPRPEMLENWLSAFTLDAKQMEAVRTLAKRPRLRPVRPPSTPRDEPCSFGEALAACMTARGITVRELARRLINIEDDDGDIVVDRKGLNSIIFHHAVNFEKAKLIAKDLGYNTPEALVFSWQEKAQQPQPETDAQELAGLLKAYMRVKRVLMHHVTEQGLVSHVTLRKCLEEEKLKPITHLSIVLSLGFPTMEAFFAEARKPEYQKARDESEFLDLLPGYMDAHRIRKGELAKRMGITLPKLALELQQPTADAQFMHDVLMALKVNNETFFAEARALAKGESHAR